MMKAIKHWTPSYVVSRTREIIDHQLHPDHPWLTRQAVALLGELLRSDDLVLEYGGGRSTPWLAQRVRHLTSVDDDKHWHENVKAMLAKREITNVRLVLHPKTVPDDEGADASYVRVADDFDANTLGMCLVDGMYRDHCAMAALPKLKAGGILAIDNANWLLPSKSASPNSIPFGGKAHSPTWEQFVASTTDWRRIWTYSGVTATALYFKP